MATDGDIHNAYRVLGTLLGAEQHEGDEEGERQVRNLLRLLRGFKQREDQEHKRTAVASSPIALAEASYQLSDGRSVYFDDGRESLRDAADLSAILPEKDATGSPNLENLQARHLLDRLQQGLGIKEHHIGTLRALMNKHADKLAKYRASRTGQDPLWIASPGPDSRIINPGEDH